MRNVTINKQSFTLGSNTAHANGFVHMDTRSVHVYMIGFHITASVVMPTLQLMTTLLIAMLM